MDLDAWLRERGIDAIAVCGIQTNFCCETTARIGSDLGYDTWFVLDATHTFDITAPDGEVVPAAEIARMTAMNLQDEFAEVVTTAAACTRPSGGAAAAKPSWPAQWAGLPQEWRWRGSKPAQAFNRRPRGQSYTSRAKSPLRQVQPHDQSPSARHRQRRAHPCR